MGAEECDWPEVRRVGPNTLIFLHDESRRWLHGVFRASAPPGLGLVPAAWPSDGGPDGDRSRVLRWPAQVLVSRVLPAAPPVQLGESLAVALADNPVRDAVISELGEGNLDDALLGKVGASALPPPGDIGIPATCSYVFCFAQRAARELPPCSRSMRRFAQSTCFRS